MEGVRIQQETHSTLDAEERNRWKQYLDECVDSEYHAGNATTLEGRAELAHRFMDDNRGSANATQSHSTRDAEERQVETLSG